MKKRFIAILALFLIVPAVSYAGTYQLVSVSVNGTSGNGYSRNPFVSSDGKFVAFTSTAKDLVYEDTIGSSNVYLHDSQTGDTILVSEHASVNHSSESRGISSDGQYVLYSTRNFKPAGAGLTNTFVMDTHTGEIIPVIIGETYYELVDADISGNGRYVAFVTHGWAKPFNNENCLSQIGIVDLVTDELICIERTSDDAPTGGFSPSINAEGTLVAFRAKSSLNRRITNHIYLANLLTGETEIISKSGSGLGIEATSILPHISPNGKFVAYLSSSKNKNDYGYHLFIRTLRNGKTERLGPAYSAVLNADGRYVAFTAGQNPNELSASLYLYDRETGVKELIASQVGAVIPSFVSISADGRFIAFETLESLVPADDNGTYDVYLYDRGPQ